MGEEAPNGAAANGEKPEPKKQDSHTEHRDEFDASTGLTTAGAQESLQGSKLCGAGGTSLGEPPTGAWGPAAPLNMRAPAPVLP